MRDKDALKSKLAELEKELERETNIMNSYKIILNSSYGKLGSNYSVLYAPKLLIQVTLTGQLALLKLIEYLEMAGIEVVSANTDGIVIKVLECRYDELWGYIKDWEQTTGFNMEETQYKALYSRDVNNYIAIKPDGTAKTKGAFGKPNLMKNPTNAICVDAVVEYLINGTPIKETVYNCKDIRKFLTVRSVKGGGQWKGEYLGKAVRWYISKNGAPITYATNGNRVATSDNCRPMMELVEGIPKDLNHGWYIHEAQSLLRQLGDVTAPGTQMRFAI